MKLGNYIGTKKEFYPIYFRFNVFFQIYKITNSHFHPHNKFGTFTFL